MTEMFPIIPASAKALWFLGGIALLLASVLALMLYLAYSCRNVQFEISPESLRIRGDLFARTIPGSRLIIDQARKLDLYAEPELRPKRRTLGTGLPGYLAGWFRLRSGEKALLFVTNPHSVVYIPTRDGYSVLLSVADLDGFLRALGTTR